MSISALRVAIVVWLIGTGTCWAYEGRVVNGRRVDQGDGKFVALTEAAVRETARVFDLQPAWLYVILGVERGKVGQCLSNTNDTYDCGPFQVNSVHLPMFARLLNMETQRVYQLLRDNGPFNCLAAGYLLRAAINDAGSVYEGMGYYHNRKPAYKNRYQELIIKSARRLADGGDIGSILQGAQAPKAPLPVAPPEKQPSETGATYRSLFGQSDRQ